MQSKSPNVSSAPNSRCSAATFNSCGIRYAGHTSEQLPQRMHGNASTFGRSSRSVAAMMQFVARPTATASLASGMPIMLPPMISLATVPV